MRLARPPADLVLARLASLGGGDPRHLTDPLAGGTPLQEEAIGRWIPGELTTPTASPPPGSPGSPVGLRALLGRPARDYPGGAWLLLALVLIAALAAGAYAWRAAPVPVGAIAPTVSTPSGGASGRLRGPASSASATSGGARAPAAPTASVVVDVVGRVRHPGVVTLPVGSRVVDALARAGGLLPGVTPQLSLARRLIDGEQIAVGVPPGTPQPGSAAGAGASIGGTGSGGSGAGQGSVPTAASSDNPLDLNAATESDFEALPGIGPVLAQRIIAWRDSHGGFRSPEQLRQVSGLGGAKGQSLLAIVRV